MEEIRKRTPFAILEIHPDNDSGLVNDLLWAYCKSAGIKMSRSRPYKKNDNAWVEQRNWTHVRKVVGYQRLDTTGELRVLRELYQQLRLYKNFFQPTMKLKSKTRVGGKIQRQYDQPRTPYQRLLDSHQLSIQANQQLRDQYEALNAARLRRNIEQLQQRLFELVEAKEPSPIPSRHRMPQLAIGAAARRKEAWKRAAGQ